MTTRPLSLTFSTPAAANKSHRRAYSARVVARWCTSAHLPAGGVDRPALTGVLLALAVVVADPTPEAFGAVAAALTLWCQEAAGEAFDGDALSPLMLSAVDAAALCSQVQLEGEGDGPEDGPDGGGAAARAGPRQDAPIPFGGG